MKRDLIYIIIILLLGIAVWILWDNSKTDSLKADLKVSTAKQQLLESEKARQAIQAHSDSVINAERQARAKDKEKDSLREVSFKRERMASNATIARLKKERFEAGIKPDSSTVKIEAEFTAQQVRDSIEIEKLRSSATLAAVSFNREIEAIETKLVAERETSLKKDDLILKQGNQIEVLGKKNKRLGKILKVAGAVILGETVYILIKFFEP